MMNHRHISVMISEQDEDFLRSMMALKGREGACGKVGGGAGRASGGGGSCDLCV